MRRTILDFAYKKPPAWRFVPLLPCPVDSDSWEMGGCARETKGGGVAGKGGGDVDLQRGSSYNFIVKGPGKI